MASGRRTPPLFEMLPRSADAPAVRVTAPAPRAAEPAPAGRADDTPARDRDDRSERTSTPGRSSALTVPLTTVWAAAALAVAATVVTWTVGYNLGFDRGRQERESAGLNEPPLTDPLVDPLVEGRAGGTPDNGGFPAGREADDGSRAPGGGQVPPPVGGEAGDLIVAAGQAAVDPRVEGHNYLALVDLSSEDARRAVAFLNARGLEAIAVRTVDSRSRRSNNPVLYRVFSVSLGIPSGEFRRLASERDRHESRILEAGRVWLRDFEGASDFRDPQWTLFNG